MRLTCPNCGAQYEVPDDVIPEEGRDVQCSNCGDTWFQQPLGHDENAETSAPSNDGAASETGTTPSADQAPEADDTPAVEIGSVAPSEEYDEDPEPVSSGSDRDHDHSQSAPAEHQPDHGLAEAAEDEDVDRNNDSRPRDTQDVSDDAIAEDPPADHNHAQAIADPEDNRHIRPARPERDATPQQRGLDPSLSEILREEAEREANLRAAAAAANSQSLETQPSLGLDDLPEDEDARRARQAKERMARLRGEDPRRLAAEASGLKRGVLPDIEEINSTLRASDSTSVPPPRQEAPHKPKKSDFTRGFALIILVAVAMIMVYSNAAQIAESLPQADPYLSSYVTWVDEMRLWLDMQVKALQQPQF